MLPSQRKASHICLALMGRASTGLGLVLAHHSLFVWLGLGPIVIIRFRAIGLRAIDITRLRLWQSVFLASSVTACCSAMFVFLYHYATLVVYPAPFHKYPEPFLYLVGMSRNYTYPEFLRDNDEEMDLLSFIRTADPTKVRIGERQRAEDEPKLLDTTVGHVVPLLPIALARAESELKASVDKLFDEGGSGNQVEQGDSASGGGGKGINIRPVTKITDTVAETVIPLQPRPPKKRKNIAADAGGPLHPPKKLKEGHETPSGASNAEVRGGPIPTLPFVTSSVSATPEREGGDHTDSVVGTNLQTAGPPQRFVISSNSSHHSGANVAEAEVDSFVRPFVPLMTVATTVTSTVDPTTTVKEKFVESFIFFVVILLQLVELITPPNTYLQKVYVPQWSVTNGSRLDDGRVFREMVDEFSPPKFFASIRGMEHDQLFTEFNVGAARQMSLSAEVRMRAKYNIRERRRLKSVVEEKDSLLKAKDEEIGNLKAQLLLKETEAAEAIRFRAEASKFETIEKSLQDEVKILKEHNAILEKEKSELGVKVADLAASVKVREQEVADLDAVVTFVKSQNDNLVNQVHELEVSSSILREKVTVYENCTEQLEKFQDERMKVVNDKFEKLYTDFIEMALHLEERFYPHLLTTISGRRWLLTHSMELAVTKCLNSPEYLSALGAAISKAIEKGMQDGLAAGITHGKEGRVLTYVAAYNPFAKADYFSALQQLQNVNFSVLAELKFNKDLSVDTLMNILRLEDTLAERLAEPLSTMALEGTEGTFGTAPDTITALSVTFVSTSSIPPISTDDYEVVHADGQEGVGADGQAVNGNAEPFPNVDDAELNIY
ncbi:hypothetical protein Tco_1473449 [Tanacetum coccineum]